jgi:hypothetical protein
LERIILCLRVEGNKNNNKKQQPTTAKRKVREKREIGIIIEVILGWIEGHQILL